MAKSNHKEGKEVRGLNLSVVHDIANRKSVGYWKGPNYMNIKGEGEEYLHYRGFVDPHQTNRAQRLN